MMFALDFQTESYESILSRKYAWKYYLPREDIVFLLKYVNGIVHHLGAL